MKDAPTGAELQRQIERAAVRFKKFRGREPTRGEIFFTRDTGTIWLCVGELDGLIYRVDDRQRARIHRFAEGRRPLILVSSDGRNATIVKGRWSFTQRGFIG